ncbi:MAG: sigma-70 family RNA polymerase sigma factor, partial [Planctomycetales bacterium]|nr:sigma-70 family RNA polymerase sigma factor [Planctomycetales bacterium]
MTHDATDVAIRFPAEDPQLRIRMHGLCYRMLGSLDEADDVLQEAYLRWRRIDASLVASPEAWLTTACTRLCIDRLRLASRQREQYPGQWLPEPLPEPLIDAENQIEVDETLSFALLLAMEALSPDQRAAFLLHDVFGLTFREVAHAIDVDEATCRQLAARARKQLRVGRARFAPTPAEMRRIGDAFFRALRTGDVELLASVLSDDATLVADGGGLASAYP